jgi:hypothetical protein
MHPSSSHACWHQVGWKWLYLGRLKTDYGNPPQVTVYNPSHFVRKHDEVRKNNHASSTEVFTRGGIEERGQAYELH